MANSKILKTTINGIEVTGRYLHRSKDLVTIQITHPYQHLKISYSILRPHRSGRLTTSSKRIPDHKLLEDLYHICRHIEKNLDLLIDSYEVLEGEIAGLYAEGFLPDRTFILYRDARKALMINGDTSEPEYRQQMIEAREKHSGYHERKQELTDHWFRSMFRGVVVHDSLKDQILDYIRKEVEVREEVD